ncbi:hypothetical protein GUJ93_ZPchr0012g20703 [Zizania palustris]|uniref:Uncharacterized protein n=1 Tax=Zizania palustris TaxID=103762 RepID=A0A8J6BRY2_ZIZPA|nr:hypothetical protein GUJ93_ZPchr0012g20703 [Zizania palustris]
MPRSSMEVVASAMLKTPTLATLIGCFHYSTRLLASLSLLLPSLTPREGHSGKGSWAEVGVGQLHAKGRVAGHCWHRAEPEGW